MAVTAPSVPYLREQRRAGVIEAIAAKKFPFPNEEFPELDTVVNLPKPTMSVGQHNGKDVYPDIVVVRRPGAWLQMMAQVEMPDTISDEAALSRWAPAAPCGDLYLYVPFGMATDAKRVAKRHDIRLKGIRLWRFRPVWGLEVADA